MNSNSSYSRECVYYMILVLAKQRIGVIIVHINAQSLNNKIYELRHLFVAAGIDIIFFSKTWFPLEGLEVAVV